VPLPRKILTEGESIVVELRPTWLVLGWPLVASIAAAILAVVVVITFPNAPVGVGYFLLALVLVAAGWLAIRALKWHTTNIVLTTSRILERRGVLSRTGVEIRLDRVNELSYRQTLIERIVHTGSLEVEVGGETGVVIFSHLPQPAALQSLITEQIDAMRKVRAGWPPVGSPQAAYAPQMPVSAAPAPAPSPTGPPPAPAQSVADRLVQLDQLRQRGILSESEFQQKKLQLLQQL
jgi:Bacterial PH domain